MAYFESIGASPFARRTSINEQAQIRKKMKAEDAAKLSEAQRNAAKLKVGDRVRHKLDEKYTAIVRKIEGNCIWVGTDRRAYSAGIWSKIE